MAIRIVQESIEGKQEALLPLIAAHRDEVEPAHKDLLELAPRWGVYEQMELAGILVALFVYDDDAIVGYSAAMVTCHLHYSNTRHAHIDVLYLAPAYRHSQTGLRLIQATEEACRARGAKLVVMHAKPESALDRLLPRLGYQVQDILHMKEI